MLFYPGRVHFWCEQLFWIWLGKGKVCTGRTLSVHFAASTSLGCTLLAQRKIYWSTKRIPTNNIDSWVGWKMSLFQGMKGIVSNRHIIHYAYVFMFPTLVLSRLPEHPLKPLSENPCVFHPKFISWFMDGLTRESHQNWANVYAPSYIWAERRNCDEDSLS